MKEFIIAQIFGGIALILACLGYFQKNKTGFLIYQVFANIFYALSFFAEGALVGGFLTFISVARSIVFYICQKKNFKYTHIFLILFIMCYIISTICLWKSWYDIIPLITSCSFTFAFYLKDIHLTRYIMIPPNVLLGVYDIITKTYLNATLALVEIVIAIVSNLKDNKKKKAIETQAAAPQDAGESDDAKASSN